MIHPLLNNGIRPGLCPLVPIMADTDLNTESLRRGLQYIPQELYDHILDFTFTASPGIRRLEGAEKLLGRNLFQRD